MLAKEERLSREVFTRYFATGRRYHSPTLTLIHTPGPTFLGAVVVSKKVSRSAVKRNTIRRRLYATLRIAGAGGLTGAIIVVAKPPLAALPRLAQHEALTTLLSQVSKAR